MTSQSRHSRPATRPGPSSSEPVGAHNRARTLDGPPSRPARRQNLPHFPSSFVGRQDDVANVATMFAESRLVTVTGLGGMGKTRFAVEVATGLSSQFPDGIWMVELAPLTDPSLVPDAIAAVLSGLQHPSGRSLNDLATHLGDQAVLLVLDNCEHLVEACGQVVDSLLRSCPGLSVLATSREPLGVGGEQRWSLGPLTLPNQVDLDAASVQGSESGALFARRAAESLPTFELTDEVAPSVAAICEQLDGIPLAIELAAARVASLSAGDVLERLDDRFGLLTTGSRTVMPRHQTLTNALEWSHDLLSVPEAALLRRLSVFADFTLDAAQTVCVGAELRRAEVVDHVGALVNKSLVLVDTAGDPVRYRLFETVRLWASAKLEEASEVETYCRRYASWCLDLAELAEMAELPEDRLDAEHGNLLAALESTRSTGNSELGVRLVAALATYWRARGHLQEGLEWLEWALSACDECPVPLRAKVLRWTGLFRGMSGDISSALPLLEESSALFAAAGNHDASLCACNSMFHMFRSPRESLAQLREQITSCRRSGDTGRLGQLLSTLGQAHFSLSELSDARQLFEECIKLGRKEGDGETLRSGLFGLGRVAGLLGEPDAAQAALDEARAQAEETGDNDDMATALGLLGDLARARGDWATARPLMAESMRIVTAEASPLSIARAMYFSARLAEAENAESKGAGELFEKALSLGRAADAPGFHEARCLLGAGSAAQVGGQRGVAAGRLLEALEIAQAIGDTWTTAQALDRLSGLARLDGRLEEADSLARRGLELHHSIGDIAGIAGSLESVAGLAIAGERWQVAARLLAAAQALLDKVGYARRRADQVRQKHELSQVRKALGKDEFEAAWVEGISLSSDEAVSYTMRGRGDRDRPESGWDSLTPAEREVVSLVGSGLTNPEVGRRLFVSPRTVGSHLSHIYRKLGIHSRVALIKELAARTAE